MLLNSLVSLNLTSHINMGGVWFIAQLDNETVIAFRTIKTVVNNLNKANSNTDKIYKVGAIKMAVQYTIKKDGNYVTGLFCSPLEFNTSDVNKAYHWDTRTANMNALARENGAEVVEVVTAKVHGKWQKIEAVK